MIRIKSFATERVVDFITILQDFPRHCYQDTFHQLFTAFWCDITVTYKLFLSFKKNNLDSLFEIISFSQPIHEEQHKIHGNELILFEIVKTNNEMMAKSCWSFRYFLSVISPPNTLYLGPSLSMISKGLQPVSFTKILK